MYYTPANLIPAVVDPVCGSGAFLLDIWRDVILGNPPWKEPKP